MWTSYCISKTSSGIRCFGHCWCRLQICKQRHQKKGHPSPIKGIFSGGLIKLCKESKRRKLPLHEFRGVSSNLSLERPGTTLQMVYSTPQPLLSSNFSPERQRTPPKWSSTLLSSNFSSKLPFKCVFSPLQPCDM